MNTEGFIVMLVEQLGLLADACRAFDSGKIRQVKAISARLYTICHDLSRSPEWSTWAKSRAIEMKSTAFPRDPKNLIRSHTPLTAMCVGVNGANFEAIGFSLVNPSHSLRLSKWCEEVVIELDVKKLSRKNLVYQMRNKDGGSHGVLEGRSEEYSALSAERGAGWVANIDGTESSIRVSALEATVRQIANELLASLLPHLSIQERETVDYDRNWIEAS